jgi:hypothetical protein
MYHNRFVIDYLDIVRKYKIKLIQVVTFAIEESDHNINELVRVAEEINSISHPDGDGVN